MTTRIAVGLLLAAAVVPDERAGQHGFQQQR